jgi:hypothetical protein
MAVMDPEEAPKPKTAPDARVHELLVALGTQPEVDPYDYAVAHWGDGGEAVALEDARRAGDQLVNARLAKYVDDSRTRLKLTNPGRYWAAHGGWFALLKEEPERASGGRERNPELMELRATYMRLRLNTFWWSFGFSVASFIFSVISLFVALKYGERLLR